MQLGVTQPCWLENALRWHADSEFIQRDRMQQASSKASLIELLQASQKGSSSPPRPPCIAPGWGLKLCVHSGAAALCLLASIPYGLHPCFPGSLKQGPSQRLSHRLMTRGDVLQVRGGGGECLIAVIALSPLGEWCCRKRTAIHQGEEKRKMEIVGHDSSIH